MSDFLDRFYAWCRIGDTPFSGPLAVMPPPGNAVPTIGAMRTNLEAREFIADGESVRWRKKTPVSQPSWTQGALFVFSDEHRYVDRWPTSDPDIAVRVCDSSVEIPWDELGEPSGAVPILRPPTEAASLDTGFCLKCFRMTSVWDIMWQAAYWSWNASEECLKRWKQCACNADKRSQDVDYVWPYRLFVRLDGSWRILDLETDEVPSDALAWCGIMSDSAKDTAYDLVGNVTRRYSSDPGSSLIDSPVFQPPTSPIIPLTAADFIENEYQTLKGWALRNRAWDSGYLTAIAYAEQLDRIGVGHGVFSAPALRTRLLAEYD